LVVGSASAGFIAKAAKRTAPDGRVVVISPEGEAMRRLEKRLAPLGLDHLILETYSPSQIPLSDHSIDRAFLVMGLSEILSLGRTIEEIHRVVKPKGQFVVHRRVLFAGLLPRQRILRICLETGFDPAASHGTLLQYTLTFEERDREHPDPT
jgi:hypothetical protein